MQSVLLTKLLSVSLLVLNHDAHPRRTRAEPLKERCGFRGCRFLQDLFDSLRAQPPHFASACVDAWVRICLRANVGHAETSMPSSLVASALTASAVSANDGISSSSPGGSTETTNSPQKRFCPCALM